MIVTEMTMSTKTMIMLVLRTKMSMVMSIMRMTMSFEVAYHRPMSLWQVDAQWLLKQKQRQSKASADPFTLHVPIQYILRP